MESSITNNLPKNSQALADKSADKAQGGSRDALHAAKEAGATLLSKADELRSDTGSALTKAVGRAQSMGRHGIDAVGDAVGDAAEQALDVASIASDSIVRYTKKNPIQALMIAAASGALLLSVIKVLKTSRD
jgi:ElaB/YqjD/DUF883 family membrane-anchored ribosome-binding protein